MKRYLLFPALTAAAGGAAFILRLLFCRTAFEGGTGLPVPGNLYGRLFLVLLAALVAALLLLSKKLPDEKPGVQASFPDAFSTSSPALLTVPVSGIFLLAASGLFDLYSGLLVNPSRLDIIAGILTVISAGCLFPVLPACRGRSGKTTRFSGNALLVPVCCLVVRLVLTYREDSINPSLSVYYVEILALVFLTLGFYRLSSFAFQSGRTRRFTVYAIPAVVLCIATLADGHSLASSLLYAGGALILLGFLLLRLAVLESGRDNG